jgi:hypothetical protein
MSSLTTVTAVAMFCLFVFALSRTHFSMLLSGVSKRKFQSISKEVCSDFNEMSEQFEKNPEYSQWAGWDSASGAFKSRDVGKVWVVLFVSCHLDLQRH